MNVCWEGKIPNITNLPTTTVLTTSTLAVENEIPSVTNLVKKTNHNTKNNEIENKIADYNHDKYITTPEFNRLPSENVTSRLRQANLARKNDVKKN